MSPPHHFSTRNPEVLEAFLRLASEGTYEWSGETGEASYSDEWCSSLGYQAEEAGIMIDFLVGLVHPDERDRVHESLHREGGECYEIEYRARRKDGSYRWTRDRGLLLAGEANGRARRWVAVSIDIDDLERTSSALRASEARFQNLADGFPSLVWMSSAGDGADFFGRRWLEYTGKTSAELTGDGWLDLVHPDDLETCKAACGRKLVEQEPFSMMIRLRGKDGDYRWFQDEGAPRYGRHGEFLGFAGACVDVHEDVARSRRLELAQFVVDKAVEATFWLRADATFTYVNESAAESLGYTREEMLQLKVHDIAPKAAKPWLQRWEDVREMGSTRFESIHRRKDGTDFPVEVTLRYIPDNEGGFIGASARDVTERYEAEAALRTSEERFKLAVEGTSDGLWDWDVPHGIVWYAPRFRELIGYDGDDTEGFPDLLDSFARDLHPDDAEATWAAVNAHLETDVPYDVEYRLRTRQGGWRWFRARGRCIRDETGRPTRMAGSIQDVTDRVESSVQLTRYAKELERSNRDLDDFAYVASHDLRQPLRGIANLANWIEEDAAEGLPADSKIHLQKLQRRTRRMDRLLEDLLQYSRAGRLEGSATTIDVHALVSDVIELLAPLEGHQVSIVGRLPTIETRRAPLEQVFHNLIGNAIKHHEGPGGRTLVSARDAGAFVEFTVSDDGPGIAPHLQKRVFRMFQTLRPRDEVEGSGMGLAIVKKLVESRGGSIHVESSEGQGATFRFTWPVDVSDG